MTNRFLVSVAALALVAGTGFANAQGTGGKESGSQMQSAPSSAGGGAATEHRDSSKGAGTSSGMKAEQNPSGTKAEQKSSTTGQGQRAEENAPGSKSKSMSSENEMKGGAKGNMKAEGREDRNSKSTEKNAQTQGHETNQNAQNREGRETNQNAQNREGRGANVKEGPESRDTNMNAQTRTGTQADTVGQAGASARLSTEQRTKIVTVIRGEHVAPVKNVDFSLTAGTRIPRDRVSLRPLPSEVVTIHPDWRGYEFFLVGDQIVVVDPRTLEIVDVLPA